MSTPFSWFALCRVINNFVSVFFLFLKLFWFHYFAPGVFWYIQRMFVLCSIIYKLKYWTINIQNMICAHNFQIVGMFCLKPNSNSIQKGEFFFGTKIWNICILKIERFIFKVQWESEQNPKPKYWNKSVFQIVTKLQKLIICQRFYLWYTVIVPNSYCTCTKYPKIDKQ